ncbi:flagellar basal body rod protein FlgB [Rhodobacteraceae bacterium WD3A24]|nr:flagellar basal body rod protein FlgB [Rhodobacteraceae bacterium WD3A24]
MFENLEVLRMAGAMAAHAGRRNAVVARNIAHADTPGYAARDLAPFAQSYADTGRDIAMRVTRPGHLTPAGRPAAAHDTASVAAESVATPNGNSVALEREMLRAAEVRHQHDLALSIYRSATTILRTSLGR